MNTIPLDTSVVICTHAPERWDDLVRAVESVGSQTRPVGELILVVDHNPDLLAKARDRWSSATVVENVHGLGLSGARNTGVALASGDLIAFLDDDAVAEPDWLERLAQPYEDAGVIGVGGLIEPDWDDGRPSWFPSEFDWVVGCTYTGVPTSRAPVRNVIGANMSFRRDVFDVVGGFRSEIGRIGSLPSGCEETELCIRAGQHWPERRVLYDPLVRVRHRVPAGRARWRYFVARCFAEGRSKAVVASLAGSRDALTTERGYAVRVLPAGIARGLRDTVLGRDAAGWLRAAAILLGTGVTVAGFLAGRAATLSPARRAHA